MSAATGRRYPLSWVCEIYRIARSSVYAWRASGSPRPVRSKRGPKTAWSDDDVVAAVREVLKASSFLGERASESDGSAPAARHASGQEPGAGPAEPPVWRSQPERPNVLWGTDATRFYTRRKGSARSSSATIVSGYPNATAIGPSRRPPAAASGGLIKPPSCPENRERLHDTRPDSFPNSSLRTWRSSAWSATSFFNRRFSAAKLRSLRAHLEPTTLRLPAIERVLADPMAVAEVSGGRGPASDSLRIERICSSLTGSPA